MATSRPPRTVGEPGAPTVEPPLHGDRVGLPARAGPCARLSGRILVGHPPAEPVEQDELFGAGAVQQQPWRGGNPAEPGGPFALAAR
jgi:hypothetical protein